MPRQNRRRPEEIGTAPRASGTAAERRDEWRGEQWVVIAVTSVGAAKAYRCPGCDQEVQPGVAHLVVWPESDSGATDRRHWHATCWAARKRRAPAIMRSRTAPRY